MTETRPGGGGAAQARIALISVIVAAVVLARCWAWRDAGVSR
jgi:hypothetical protein